MSRTAARDEKGTATRGWSPWLVGGLVIIVLVAALGSRWLPPLEGPAFETLVVRGEHRQLVAEDLREHIAPYLEDGYFGADLEEIRASVEGLGWVAGAEVRRRWPSTLELRVREQRPVAVWNREGFLNPRAELFVPEEIHRDPGRLPELSGPEDSRDAVFEGLGTARATLGEAGLEVAEINLSERRAWTVVLQGGTEIRLGREDFEPRLERFVEVVVPALGAGLVDLAHVDMRYTNGFAVAHSERDSGQGQEDRNDG